MHLIDLAENIHFELDSPADPSIVKIHKWLLFHLGDLNDHLSLSYAVSGNDSDPELSEDVAVIYAALYLNSYYSRLIRDNLGAAAYSIIEVKEGDETIRLANRNEVSKTYIQLKNQNTEYLYKLIEAYKRNQCLPTSLHTNFYCSITRVSTT